MKPRCLFSFSRDVLLLLLFPLALCLVPVYTLAGQWVITPQGATQLDTLLKEPQSLPAGWKTESLDVSGSELTLCLARGKDAFCMKLSHADPATPQDAKAGTFAIQGGRGFDAKRYAGPLAALKKALSTLPQDVWTSTDAAAAAAEALTEEETRNILTLLDNDRNAEARAMLLSLRTAHPDLRELSWIDLRLLIQESRFDEARNVLSLLGDRPDERGRKRFESARLAVLSGNPDQALPLLRPDDKAGGEKDPRCASESFAVVLDFRGRLDEALAWRRAALAETPACTDLWHGMIPGYIDHGRAKDLLELAQAELARNKDHQGALAASWHALRRLGRIKEARRDLEHLYDLTQSPYLIPLHSTLAANNPADDETFAYIVKRHREKPDDPLAWHAYAVMSYYRHDYKTVIPAMDALRPLLPNDSRVLIYGAMSRYQLGDWDGALAWLTELGKRGATDPDYDYCLAVLWHDRDREKALFHLDRYLSHPAHADEFPDKRRRAVEYRAMLAKGEPINDWAPLVSKTAPEIRPAGCATAAMRGEFFLFVLLLMVSIRARRIG